jgi:hypothetical protein
MRTGRGGEDGGVGGRDSERRRESLRAADE